MLLVLYVLIFFGISHADERMHFKNNQVLRLLPKTAEAIEALKQFGEQRSFLDFWKEPSKPGQYVDIMVPLKYKVELEIFLRNTSIEYNIFISDVQALIDEEKLGEIREKETDEEFGWNKYHTLEEINAWLKLLTSKAENVELVTMGQTYEGRNLTGVYISFSTKNANRSVFIESNIHAREWISGATSTYIINQLLWSKDIKVQKLAQSYDWYILPIANPDGYVYTHEKNRMWRKTRKPSSSKCIGTDPNRNWDNHWGEFGASTNPCSDSYGGSEPFSETATETLSQYLSTIGNKLVAYFTIHSYSQLLMIPYGYSPEPLDNYNVTYPIAKKAAEALSYRYGTEYTVGTIYDVVYPASGGSCDWVKATFGTPLVYAYELRDTGKYGFLLPPRQIVPTALETLDSIVKIFEEYEKL